MTQYSDTDELLINNTNSIDWCKYEWTNGYLPHTITEAEIYRPYLLALKYFDDIEYEDIILILNNISNIFELRPGVQIRIPRVEDVDKFLADNAK